jgi:hypothetical protein
MRNYWRNRIDRCWWSNGKIAGESINQSINQLSERERERERERESVSRESSSSTWSTINETDNQSITQSMKQTEHHEQHFDCQWAPTTTTTTRDLWHITSHRSIDTPTARSKVTEDEKSYRRGPLMNPTFLTVYINSHFWFSTIFSFTI